MPKASSIKPEFSKQSFLFKGPQGFGKSLAAATFAVAGPVYLAYWDKKIPVELSTFFTKQRFGDKAEQILDNITYDVYGANNAHEYLNFLIDLAKGGCRYTTLINDSVTWMTSSIVNWSLNFDRKNLNIRDLKDLIPDWDEYKVETSFVSQCLDLSRTLPANVIWTGHPIAGTKVEGSGNSIKVTKVTSLVSYGAKVASMIPGAFTEIYHFGQKSDWNSATSSSSKRFICYTDAVGDDFAKSPLFNGVVKEIDYTDRLFYEVWMENVKQIYTIKETVVANPFVEGKESKVTEWKPSWQT